MSKLITKKLDQEQQKLELALKDKLIEDPSRKNFQEAYDQLHTFFIEQKKI